MHEPFKSIDEVKYYLSGEKIQCLICDKWCKSVGVHVAKAHFILANDYKEMFGIPWTYSLACPDSQEKYSSASKRNKKWEKYLNKNGRPKNCINREKCQAIVKQSKEIANHFLVPVCDNMLGKHASEQTRIKQSIGLKRDYKEGKRKIWNKGLKYSCPNLKGHKPWNKGLKNPFSDEALIKIKHGVNKYWRDRSGEFIIPFSECLRSWLKYKNITITELARILNIKYPYISQLCSGKCKRPRKKTQRKIANALGITIEQLKSLP